MLCKDIGEANADIAGIGIIIAFAFQAIASWLLSVILEVFLPDPLRPLSFHSTRPVQRSLFTIDVLRDQVDKVKKDLSTVHHEAKKKAESFRKLSEILADLHGYGQNYIKDSLDAISNENDRNASVPKEAYERSPPQIARAVVADILWVASDGQTLAGIGLALVGVIRQKSLSLYQLHLLYDTINLTSVSNCAALASASAVDTSDLLTRMALMLLFTALYLVYSILFGIRLGQWDDNVAGYCFNARALALPNASHPYVDKIYLAVTCLYTFSVLGLAISLAISRCEVDPTWSEWRQSVAKHAIRACRYNVALSRGDFYRLPALGARQGAPTLLLALNAPLKILLELPRINPVLTIAMLQLPLHLYYIIRLRLSNEPLLADGGDESQWGFGQIYALIISAGLVVECCKGFLRYCNARRQWARNSSSGREDLSIEKTDVDAPSSDGLQQDLNIAASKAEPFTKDI